MQLDLVVAAGTGEKVLEPAFQHHPARYVRLRLVARTDPQGIDDRFVHHAGAEAEVEPVDVEVRAALARQRVGAGRLARAQAYRPVTRSDCPKRRWPSACPGFARPRRARRSSSARPRRCCTNAAHRRPRRETADCPRSCSFSLQLLCPPNGVKKPSPKAKSETRVVAPKAGEGRMLNSEASPLVGAFAAGRHRRVARVPRVGDVPPRDQRVDEDVGSFAERDAGGVVVDRRGVGRGRMAVFAAEARHREPRGRRLTRRECPGKHEPARDHRLQSPRATSDRLMTQSP